MKKLDRIDPKSLSTNPRASLNSWLKFRDVVVAAIKEHPRPYVYTPTNMTPGSVSSKIRDAIRGCLAFGYPCEVSPLDMAKWYEEVIIKHDKESVFIGPAVAVQSALVGTQRSPDSPSNLIFTTLTFEEVSAFALLLSNGRILGPILIKNPPDLTLLPKRPNVEMLQRTDGLVLL